MSVTESPDTDVGNGNGNGITGAGCVPTRGNINTPYQRGDINTPYRDLANTSTAATITGGVNDTGVTPLSYLSN